jgi:outer membrane protein assembly factor BamB
MRRSVVAAVVVVLLVIAGSVYVAGPQLLKGTPGSSGPAATVSVSASLSASAQNAASGASSAQDWTTYHANNNRTGYMPVSNFTSVAKGWTSPALDGLVFAEPLVYGGDVFVATENNSVYALSAQDGTVVWHTNLGPGSPTGNHQLPCGDIFPVTGITGTPVIDPSTGLLYVVSDSNYHHVLSALKVSDGSVVFYKTAEPPGFNESTQQQRTALTLANGMVYFGYGGLAGDCGQYWGYEVGIPANGTGSMVYYQVPTAREGAIWAPDGATVDSSGNVYVATGNAASETTFDHGNSVIKLSPTLKEEGYFAPTNWAQLSTTDSDLGSLAPVFVGPHTLFQIGKEGEGYLLNSDDLGGIGGQSFEASVCDESFGGTAFVNSTVFVPCINGLFELQVANSSFFSTKLVVSGFNAGPPIVTGGVVWSVDDNTGTLYGLSTTTGHEAYTFALGNVMHFTSPSAGDGQLFVAAGDVVKSFVLG